MPKISVFENKELDYRMLKLDLAFVGAFLWRCRSFVVRTDVGSCFKSGDGKFIVGDRCRAQ